MIKIKKQGNNTTILILEDQDLEVLFSYETPVACRVISKNNYFVTDKFWSKTTSKHINQFCKGNNSQVNPQWSFDKILDEWK